MGLHKYLIFIIVTLLFFTPKERLCFAQVTITPERRQELLQRLNHNQMEYAGHVGRLNGYDRSSDLTWVDRSFRWLAGSISDSANSIAWLRRDLAPIPSLLNQGREQINNGQLDQALQTINELDYRLDQATNDWNQTVTRGMNGAQGITLATLGVGAACSAAMAPSIVGAAGCCQ